MKRSDRLKTPLLGDNTGNWQQRHRSAILGNHPVAVMLRAWLDYADRYTARYDSGIGEDTVLGDEWAAIGRGLLGLLNGDCGQLDCGTVDGIIRAALIDDGFKAD